MEKKIPNPNGKKGNKDHQDCIENIFKKLLNKFTKVQKEFKIDLPNGKKRFVDVAGLDKNGKPAELHQVGRKNKNGSAVIRERRAKKDIQKATGLKVIFHALILIICLFIAGLLIYKINSKQNKNIVETQTTK